MEMKINLLLSMGFTMLLMLCACAEKESLTTGKIFAEPDFELSAVRFIDIDMERLNLDVDLKVINPNYVSLEFQNVNYQLNIDGTRVLSGVLSEPITVAAKGDDKVTIPLTVKLDRLANGALNLMMNRRLQYELNIKFESAVPIIEKKTFSVKKAGDLTF